MAREQQDTPASKTITSLSWTTGILADAPPGALLAAPQVFYHVSPDPTLACINAGLKEILDFKPDVIIAMGGGSPMDAAKIMWLMYEQPDVRRAPKSMLDCDEC